MVYPFSWTSDVRVWVPDPPAGIYKIKAEMWRVELVPGTASEYRGAAVIATDEISVVIPPKPSDITQTTSNPPQTTVIQTPPQTTPNTSPVTDPGAIYVYSTPGDAEIWINGKQQVNTNYSATGVGFTDLQPGRYTVTVRKQGYIDYTEVVNLNPNEIYDVKAVLQPGTTPTGWIKVDTDPPGVNIFINGKSITTAPTTLTDVPPGSYDITLKKDGYKDWNDTITVTAGNITEVNAELPVASGGFPVGPVAGGAAVVIGGGVLVKVLSGRGKGAILKTPPQTGTDLYKEWWDKASPDERKNWDSFEKYLSNRLGSPSLTGYIDEHGNPSWASAHTSWQQEFNKGETKSSFEDWVKAQSANQHMTQEMMQRAEANKNFRPKDIVDASAKYSAALRNQERFQKLTQIKNAVAGDSTLSSFADEAGNAIVDSNGQVDANKLNQLEGTLKRWIVRDKMMPQTPDYTYSDALQDTVRQGSQNVVVRLGAAYLTGGYSEMALNPISAISTMGKEIMDGKSTFQAVTDGLKQSSFELALGESGRLLKYASPYIKSAKDSYNLTKLSNLNSELSSEVSTINQLAKQTDDVARYSRDAYMKSTEMVKVGKTASAGMDEAEKLALKLNNNPEYRKLLAENSKLIPDDVKDVMGIAKQKAYEQARNTAVDDVVKQMAKDGVPTGENPLFLKQTGTHARPGNPGWDSLKSDFDHTADFGSSKYNQMYEQQFNTHLESQGTSATSIDANVYGTGTSSRGAYTGGAKKFVENYNQTTGSDVMIRTTKDGLTTISREEPQVVDSLLSKMKPDDIASAKTNYQDFFNKSLGKGGSVDNMIKNSSKEVSRTAGQYSVNYVDNFHNTGSVNYSVPKAAQVADLIKKKGFSVNTAIEKVGYTGGKDQLLTDYKNIMGVH